MKINRKLLMAVALATAAPIGLLAPGATAQDDVEEIIVTGSHIRGTAENAELPVDVLRRQDLVELGSPTLIEWCGTLVFLPVISGKPTSFRLADKPMKVPRL